MANIHSENGLKLAIIFIGIDETPYKRSFFQKYFSDAYTHVDMAALGSRQRERTLLRQCYRHGESYVTDCPNVTVQKRKKYIDSAKEHGYRIIGYYFPIDAVLEREGKRAIPDKQLIRACTKMRSRMEAPSYSEGFDEIYTVVYRNGDFETERMREQKTQDSTQIDQ